MKIAILLTGLLIVLALSAGAVAASDIDIPICDNGQCETSPPPEMMGGAGAGGGIAEEISEAEAKADPLIPPGVTNFKTVTESVVSTAGMAARRCWRMKPIKEKAFYSKRGLTVYFRIIYQVSEWCAVYGQKITWRRTTSWARTDDDAPLCRPESPEPRDSRVSGGVGFSWVTVRSEIQFACWVPLWKLPDPTFYFINSVDVSYNAWGAKTLVRSEN